MLWAALGIITVAILIGLFALHAGNILDHSEAAYADFMNSISESSGELRFELGYINDDDIPELMFCYGDWHAVGIYICSLNQDSGAVEVLGEYSSFGTFDYYERRDIIVSQYGGMGFWYHIYGQSGASGEGKILAIEGAWGTEEGIQYYWQSTYEALKTILSRILNRTLFLKRSIQRTLRNSLQLLPMRLQQQSIMMI